jgi:shikimate dehydrogenase
MSRRAAGGASASGYLDLLTGSFSTPAAGNPTVVMVEAAYRHHGLRARYINCDVAPENLAPAVAGARAMGWAGFNCSLPHKLAVKWLLDRLAPSVGLIDAVNCVVNRDGELIGENTDGRGFLASLRTVVDPTDRTMLLLGAGGAARAIAVETALAGAASVTIVARNSERGTEIAEVIATRTPATARVEPWTGSYRIPKDAEIVVNATSVGLAGTGDQLLDVELDALSPDAVVADVIPNPPQTPFLRSAAERGCRTLDGLGMLVAQAAIAITLWTGTQPDTSVMRAALEAALGVAQP